MAKQNEAKKEQTYTIHTVAGKTMSAKGVSVEVDAKQNRVFFLDAEGKPKDDRIFILSGIVAIEPSSGKVGEGHFRM